MNNMLKQKASGYESPAISVCNLQNESVLCASTGINDLTVKEPQDWGWED